MVWKTLLYLRFRIFYSQLSLYSLGFRFLNQLFSILSTEEAKVQSCCSNVKFHKLLQVITDKGYQGIAKLHNLSKTPLKKPRAGKLTKSQKKFENDLPIE